MVQSSRAGAVYVAQVALAALLVCTAAASPQSRDEVNLARQARAAAEIRQLGTALLAWWIEHAGEEAFDQLESSIAKRYDVTRLPVLATPQVEQRLDLAARKLSLTDPWGQAYEVRLALPTAERRGGIAIRSGGSNKQFESDIYGIGPTADAAGDVVWADGFFVLWPRESAR